MTDLRLVPDYSSSSEEEDLIECTAKKRKFISRTPLNESNVDDKGRVRTFAHEAGNWATFVAISIMSSPELEEFVDGLEEQFAPHVILHKIEDLHVSLTRVVVLRHHWINEFISSLKNMTSKATRFSMMFHGIEVYTNDERNRTFVSLKINSGQNYLDTLVEQLDDLLAGYNLDRFYKERSYHVSIFWVVGDLKKELEDLVGKLMITPLCSFTHSIPIDSCFSKIGNKLYTFPFG